MPAPTRLHLVATRLLVLVCAALATESSAQQRPVPPRDFRGELDIRGRVEDLSVTPGGHLWLATAAGGLYHAPRVDADWQAAAITGFSSSDGMRLGPGMKRIEFFDDSVGFGWGMTQDYQRRVVQVIRTGDGGRSWRGVDVGPGSWVGAAFARSGGEAWLSVVSTAPGAPIREQMFHSGDHGRSWSALESFPRTQSPVSVIFMESSVEGFLAELNDGIYQTGDGWRSWRRLPTPRQQQKYEKDSRRDSFARIHELVPFGDWILVNQDGHLFASRRDTVRWEPIVGGRLRRIALDRRSGRLFAMDDSLRVVELDRDLRPRRVSDAAFLAPPLGISAVSGRVYTVDVEGRLNALDEAGLSSAFPLTSGGPTRPMTLVRAGVGDLWGTTGRYLYSSADAGARWYRLPYDTATVRGLRVRDADEALVWDGRGTNVIVNRRTGAVTPVRDLAGEDVVDVVEHRGRWYAFGGMQYQSAQRVEVARSFYAGEFRGSRGYGFVYVSSDRGRRWTRVDRWAEGGVMQLFLHPDGDLVLQSYTGSIRRVRRTGDGYAAETVLLATPQNRDSVPYVEAGYGLYFADDSTGYVGGWIHHVGERFFRTGDGGRSWRSVDKSAFPFRNLIPRGNEYLALTDSAVHVLRGDQRRTVADLTPVLHGQHARIRYAADTPDGRRVLLHRMDDALLLLDPRSGKWEVLREGRPPPGPTQQVVP